MLQHSSGNRLLHAAAYCMLLHVGQPIAKVLQIIKAPRRGGKFVAGRLQLASCKSVLSILVQATNSCPQANQMQIVASACGGGDGGNKMKLFLHQREKQRQNEAV